MTETREIELLRRLERVLERLLRADRRDEARVANTRWVEWRVRRAFRRTIGQSTSSGPARSGKGA